MKLGGFHRGCIPCISWLFLPTALAQKPYVILPTHIFTLLFKTSIVHDGSCLLAEPRSREVSPKGRRTEKS